MKKRILFFLLLAVVTAAQSFASDFDNGVLNYTIIKDAGGAATTNVRVDGLVNTSTTSITIPATVTNTKDNKVYNVTSIEYAFENLTGLTSVTIPASVTSIGDHAFYNCTGLTSIDLSNATGLQTIGVYAFSHCTGLTSIDLSAANKLQTIGEEAFSYCSAAKFKTAT